MKNTLDPQLTQIIQQALDEDIGSGDVTSNSIIPPEAQMSGQIVAKQSGVIAGLEIAAAVYQLFDPQIRFQALVEEGARIDHTTAPDKRFPVALVTGSARSLLTVERTALNFMGRISGIASLTRQFVVAVAETSAVILDTRKTAPGLRRLDKLAVSHGGGANHRIGLFDMILIKDNHIDFSGSLSEAIRRARAAQSGLPIEVEARTLEQVQEALELGVDRILLDNMPVEWMAAAVRLSAGRAKLEASGNISLQNVRQVAETGVDFISVGALTHSAQVFDLSFDYLR